MLHPASTTSEGNQAGDTTSTTLPQRIQFENSSLELQATFSVFITVNPGYAGRTELPDNLKSLFRPTAMYLPDFDQIAEIMLYSQGFLQARELAKKLIDSQKMAQQILSQQPHYDYGLRALKSTLLYAGKKKIESPETDENELLFQAMRDINLPKFLPHDVILYEFLLKDFFPLIFEKHQILKARHQQRELDLQRQLKAAVSK